MLFAICEVIAIREGSCSAPISCKGCARKQNPGWDSVMKEIYVDLSNNLVKGKCISLPNQESYCKLLGAPHNLQEFYGHTNLHLGNDAEFLC